MRMSVGAPVDGRDGHLGTFQRAVMEPETRQITHLVVRTGLFVRRNVVVPIDRLVAFHQDSDEIELDLTKDQIERMPDYIRAGDPDEPILRPADDTLLDVPATSEPELVAALRNVRDSLVDIHGGMPVECTDGTLGLVDEVWIDPDTCQVTGVQVRGGLLALNRIDVPLDSEAHVTADRVVLSFPKARLTRPAA